MKKLLGYVCFVLSFVAWGVIAALPFIDISKGEIAAATTFLIISGEVLFLISIALLGKEAWDKIKGIFKRNKEILLIFLIFIGMFRLYENNI